jgi:hypothetical protein
MAPPGIGAKLTVYGSDVRVGLVQHGRQQAVHAAEVVVDHCVIDAGFGYRLPPISAAAWDRCRMMFVNVTTPAQSVLVPGLLIMDHIAPDSYAVGDGGARPGMNNHGKEMS